MVSKTADFFPGFNVDFRDGLGNPAGGVDFRFIFGSKKNLGPGTAQFDNSLVQSCSEVEHMNGISVHLREPEFTSAFQNHSFDESRVSLVVFGNIEVANPFERLNTVLTQRRLIAEMRGK